MKRFIISPKHEQKPGFQDGSAILFSGRRSPLVLCPPKDILEFFEWNGSLIEDNVFKMGRQTVLTGAGFWICLVSNRPLHENEDFMVGRQGPWRTRRPQYF